MDESASTLHIKSPKCMVNLWVSKFDEEIWKGGGHSDLK